MVHGSETEITGARAVRTILMVIGLWLSAIVCAVPSASAIQTLATEFRLERSSGTGLEVVKGIVHYSAPDFTLIHVSDPIEQYFRVDSTSVVIYYPDEERALRLPAANTLTFPFFHALISIQDSDLNLSHLGFGIASSGFSGDSLIVRWEPPTALAANIGAIVMAYHSDRLVSLDFIDPKGNLLQRTTYSDYIVYKEDAFPLSIMSTSYGLQSAYERMDFESPRFDLVLPDSIVSFEIPPDIEIEDVYQ